MTELNTPSSKEIARFYIETTINSNDLTKEEKVKEISGFLAASIKQNNVHEENRNKERKILDSISADLFQTVPNRRYSNLRVLSDIAIALDLKKAIDTKNLNTNVEIKSSNLDSPYHDHLEKENELLKAETALTRLRLHEMNNLVLGTTLFNDVATPDAMIAIIKELEKKTFDKAIEAEKEDLDERCKISDELVKEAKAGANNLWDFLRKRGHFLPKESETTTLDKLVKQLIIDVENQDILIKELRSTMNEQSTCVNLFYQLTNMFGIVSGYGDHSDQTKTNHIFETIRNKILTCDVLNKEREEFIAKDQASIKQNHPGQWKQCISSPSGRPLPIKGIGESEIRPSNQFGFYQQNQHPQFHTNELNGLFEAVHNLIRVNNSLIDPSLRNIGNTIAWLYAFTEDYKAMKRFLRS